MTEARCSGVETEIQGDKAHCLKKKKITRLTEGFRKTVLGLKVDEKHKS